MSYRITDCRGFAPNALSAAMNQAFSDYATPMRMSVQQFVEFQRQRGFSHRHSFVALKDETIAAFWFSGGADPRQGDRAYTLSVGTDPAHRRKGLSQSLFRSVAERLRAEGAYGLQLEVMTSNLPALSAYERFGFRRHRDLRVVSVRRQAVVDDQLRRWNIVSLSPDDLPGSEEPYFDTWPTPQNSRSALVGLWPDVHLIGVEHDGALLGWAAAFRDGLVAQIAVDKAWRRRGIGRELLVELGKRTDAERLVFVNVDADADGVNAFLASLAAEETLMQHEMRLDGKAFSRPS